jgi:hypothetical protein
MAEVSNFAQVVMNAISSGGAWPAVVLCLGSLASILITFGIVQSGRPNVTLIIPWIMKIIIKE